MSSVIYYDRRQFERAIATIFLTVRGTVVQAPWLGPGERTSYMVLVELHGFACHRTEQSDDGSNVCAELYLVHGLAVDSALAHAPRVCIAEADRWFEVGPDQLEYRLAQAVDSEKAGPQSKLRN